MFAQAYKPGWRSDSWNNSGNKNPRFNSKITFNRICSNFEKGISQETLATRLGCSITPITNRLKDEGFNSWSDFVNNYENHKVVSVEYYGTIPLYDLTVDGYKNFATDSVISHNTPEIAAALNIYADECTTGDERGKTFHILSSNPQIKKSLDELFYDILNIEFNLRPWIRNLVKYGDLFLYNEVIPDIGVVNVQPIRVNELEREEGWDPNDPYAVRFKWLTRGNRYLENWQVTHMRILGNDMFLPYGTSILEPARRIWRQLTMMEDSMLVYRVVRSPERRVFYIDVGNIAPNDIPSYMEQAKQTLRARDVVSRQDGRVDQRYNPLPVHKDTPIPLLDGRTISIEDLSKEYDTGKENWVYSMQDQTQQIVPGKVIWCGKNYTAQKLIKVWLDDDTYITTAPEHPFVLRDGSSKRADELIIGQSLMPFYRDENSLGYERCYNPATQKYETTHSLVAKNIFSEKWIKTNQPVVHHKKPWQGQSNKKNNHPSNLEIMNFWEHRKWHRDFIQHTLLREDVLKENSKRICEFNKTLEHSINVSQTNRKYNKGKKLAQAYNGTELHKQHNELRTRAQKESWEKNSLSRRKAMRWNIPELFWAELSKIVKENPTLGREKIHNLLMQNESIVQALKANQNTERSVEKFSFAAWEGELVRKGFAKLAGYREHILNEQNIGYKNHKIKNIEVLEVSGEDVYCMTVVGPEGEDDRHNFAAQTICNDNKASNNGVFVLNSVDDDYFIPVRGGQTGTKIETLAGGQNATATEDVEYLQKKLFAAIQVPKPYLNFTEGMSAKASLAQQDVRFSRTIIALQKIAIAELNKLAMIHLYSKGFNEEDLLDFHLKLANPSTIALLQKLENLASKFDIAAKAKETKLVDELWIQKNIIELSDDELMNIEQGRREDKIREVELESIAVSANPDPGPARMVSPFDNSNYEIPGEDVSRVKPSKEDDFFQKMDDYSQIQNYKKEQEEETFARPDVDGTSPPVQATPFVKRTEKNRLRRVGAGGKSNLEMPDFGAMFDRKNVSLTDIYDKKFLDNPLIERVLEEELNLNANNFIPRDFVSTLDKLKIFLEQNRVKTKMVLEENEQIEIKMNNDELLIESVDRGNESSDENEKVDISEIDLSRID
jgi:intein/homing endonuclease